MAYGASPRTNPLSGNTTTRGNILETARTIAAERGFGATSYRDIATPLGISKAAIYHHYSTKDEILLDLVGPLLEATEDLIERAAGGRPSPAAERVLDEYLRVLLEHRPTLPLVLQDLSVLNHPVVGPRLRDQQRAITALLAGPQPDEAAQARVAAALGALEGPLVALETNDRLLLRRVLLPVAMAAIEATQGSFGDSQRPRRSESVGEQVDLTASMRFPPGPESVARARRFVNDTLGEWHFEEVAEVTTLLTSELVTNSVVHAETDVVVAVSLSGPRGSGDTGRARVEVADYDLRMPTLIPGASTAGKGRGLLVVDALASAWGMERRGTTKAVWFEVPLDGSVQGAVVGG